MIFPTSVCSGSSGKCVRDISCSVPNLQDFVSLKPWEVWVWGMYMCVCVRICSFNEHPRGFQGRRSTNHLLRNTGFVFSAKSRTLLNNDSSTSHFWFIFLLVDSREPLRVLEERKDEARLCHTNIGNLAASRGLG